MFVRVKTKGPYRYLQIVENHREGKRTVQRVLATLGRADELAQSGGVDVLLKSLGRFATQVRVIQGYEEGRLEAGALRHLGPDLVFGRLWKELGLDTALNRLLRDRGFEFPVERAVYLAVLHRLFESGSDRAGDRWRRDVLVPGSDGLKLHHLYRARRWLGDSRDEVEKALFQRRRHLFTECTLAFFDTTSLSFEGRGGESLGQFGFSKDHRPDRRQMIVGAVLTEDGRPVCCQFWPGNQSDVQALLPVVAKVKQRFGLKRMCWVADRGMTAADTIDKLEEQKLEYILGARLRRHKEVRDLVLGCPGRYRQVADNLRVKEVWVQGRRYVVCHNPQEAAKDAADREAILQALEDKLRQGADAWRRGVWKQNGPISAGISWPWPRWRCGTASIGISCAPKTENRNYPAYAREGQLGSRELGVSMAYASRSLPAASPAVAQVRVKGRAPDTRTRRRFRSTLLPKMVNSSCW
jgi:hypothetical protein